LDIFAPARDRTADLQVRKLILPHRDEVGVAEQDVRSLVHGVGKHQPRQAASTALLGGGGLGLDGGVALQLGHRDQRQERQQELVQHSDSGIAPKPVLRVSRMA
jgi:hypothetical protein